MIVIVMTSLAVLAAAGVKVLSVKLSRTHWLVVTVISFLVLLENIGAPFHTARLPVPDIYRTMAFEYPDYAILDIPIEEDMLLVSTYFQIVHKKPIVEGQFARHSEGSTAFLKGDEFLRAVSENKLSEYYLVLKARPDSVAEMLETRRKLIEERVKYVCLHTWHMNSQDEAVARKLVGLLQPTEVAYRVPYMKGEIVVYRLY
jgi:hypothetical protein